jgi:DNA-binding transcriptional ArsR family regulator
MSSYLRWYEFCIRSFAGPADPWMPSEHTAATHREALGTSTIVLREFSYYESRRMMKGRARERNRTVTSRDTSARVIPHPAREELSLVDVLHALADPMRLQVVRRLDDSELPMACAALELPVSKATTTHHFRVLREAGVIRQRYEGTARLSELRVDDLDARFPGLLDAVLRAED